MEKKKGKVSEKERTVFNDEEQRRYVIVHAASFHFNKLKVIMHCGSVEVSITLFLLDGICFICY